jgi:hypothetical protein
LNVNKSWEIQSFGLFQIGIDAVDAIDLNISVFMTTNQLLCGQDCPNNVDQREKVGHQESTTSNALCATSV